MNVDEFVELVREYKDLVDDAASLTAHGLLSSCASVLPRIYAAGISLTDVEPEGEDVTRSTELPIQGKLGPLLGRYDYYILVFDPYVLQKPVGGIISSDLAEIYDALVGPLISFEAGRVKDAVWTWKFNLRGLCGDHIVNTMRAIHRLVHDHMPEDYVATQGDKPDDFVSAG